jgi:hypothetical protein
LLIFVSLKVATFDVGRGEFWFQMWNFIFKFNVEDNKSLFRTSKIVIFREKNMGGPKL